MAYIEWTGALRIGIDEIDGQHRRLVDLINELADARDGGREATVLGAAVAALADYAASHFALEEELFKRFDYPGTESHVREHAAFTAKVASFTAALGEGASKADEMLVFLRTWLTTHISFSDKKYASLFRERGLA